MTISYKRACELVDPSRTGYEDGLRLLGHHSEEPGHQRDARAVIPRFSVEGMAEDLRRKLTIETLKAVLRWEPCFEEFLREKGEKAASEDTIQPPGIYALAKA